MTGRVRKKLFTALLLLGGVFTGSQMAVNANPPDVSYSGIEKEAYYDTLREAFYMGDYDEVGACNGWVQRVINKSGLIGELVVDGTTVEELNDALDKSPYATLVASRTGDQNDYQDTSDDMIRDVNEGKIKAGDILIFTKNMNDYYNTPSPHWLHAAIAMEENYHGKVENYQNYGLTRWRDTYIGYPSMAHALAPIFGVEYYTPMTSVHSYDAGADDGSTGYYVYRLEPEKYQEDLKKAEEEKKKSEEAAKNTTEAAKPQTTESPSGNGGAVSTEAEQTETGVQEMNTSSVNSGGGMEKVGNILGVLITLLSLALILFLVLLI